MPLKTILIDDEKDCLRVLELELEKFQSEIEVLALCSSGKEGLYAVKEFSPDVIFLDIDMPYMDGFEFLELLPNKELVDIVFVTAHNEYAIKAIKASAVDYLLKPIKSADLVCTIEAIVKKRRNTNTNRYTFLLNQLKSIQANQMTKIALPTFDGLTMIQISDIIYCEADDNYAYVQLMDSAKLLITKPLRFLQEILPEELFYRNHKSFLINLKRINQFVKADGGYLVMEGGSQIPISRSKKEILINLINQQFSI